MHIEPELEALLKGLAPGCEQQWAGATHDEIDELEIQADVQLPPFYRWFLEHMGQSMGPIANPRQDLSVTTVLDIYRRRLVPARTGLLLVGILPDEVMPMHLYYDLRKPAREDALVRIFDPQGEFVQNASETLRELIGWSAFVQLRIDRCAHRCRGLFRTEQGDVLPLLAPVATTLGFRSVLPSGRSLAIYERSDAALECSLVPADRDRNYMFFEIGAADEVTIRSVLGTIDLESGLQVEVREGTPRRI